VKQIILIQETTEFIPDKSDIYITRRRNKFWSFGCKLESEISVHQGTRYKKNLSKIAIVLLHAFTERPVNMHYIQMVCLLLLGAPSWFQLGH